MFASMRKLILIIICLPTLFSSCINDSNKNKINNSIKESIVSFSVTSKNSELITKSGKEVSLDEMITINIKSGDKILFKTFYFTLDNKVDGALNFYSTNRGLICNPPSKLSIMSMPPNGDGLKTYNGREDFEIIAMTLIKIDSINFVISNIKIDK